MYKAKILPEYEATPDGEKRSVIRREGLYSSQITGWRLARDAGALGGLEPGSRKPKRSATEVELEKLKAKHQRTETELARTRLALDIMGKASALLASLAESVGVLEPVGVTAVVDAGSWTVPTIFGAIRRLGPVGDVKMVRSSTWRSPWWWWQPDRRRRP